MNENMEIKNNEDTDFIAIEQIIEIILQHRSVVALGFIGLVAGSYVGSFLDDKRNLKGGN